ncbi:putative lactoylglutathione lyase [Variovorax sp. SRS16]|uniref:VOC family protein n=1 Tax=Variovorax sp. SRS16 TaxID=282217 RepID=UPI001318A556|nr:VOC family protein [Variovorax sp. SRS16]VTU22833.1 putative lactoylglutathione lyase [Variovorax sp. SRS16]
MAQNLWLNLPVKDLARSRAFFEALGFAINDRHGQSHMVSLVVGDPGVIVNLFPESAFAAMAGAGVSDAAKAAEVMLSLGANSREEVDTLTRKAKAAGATVFGEPAEVQGWMYGSGFADLDGHRWNLLHMDMGRMPKG